MHFHGISSACVVRGRRDLLTTISCIFNKDFRAQLQSITPSKVPINICNTIEERRRECIVLVGNRVL